MNKDFIRIKWNRILVEKQSALSKILNNRIQTVYGKHKDTLNI